jgi:hypothetical protein
VVTGKEGWGTDHGTIGMKGYAVGRETEERERKVQKVKVPVYSLISMHRHVQPTHYPPWHGADTRTHSHMMIQLWIRAPGTHHCWVARGNVGFRNLPGVSTHDHLGNRTPDLSLSSPPPYHLGHVLLYKTIINSKLSDVYRKSNA